MYFSHSIKDIIKLSRHGQRPAPFDETYTRALVESFYSEDGGVKSWPAFIKLFDRLKGTDSFIK